MSNYLVKEKMLITTGTKYKHQQSDVFECYYGFSEVTISDVLVNLIRAAVSMYKLKLMQRYFLCKPLKVFSVKAT